MADFVITYPGSVGGTVTNGTPGEDRLIITYTSDGAVSNSLSGTLAGGYSGTFFGAGGGEDDFAFTGMENITFDHTSGTGNDNITTGDGRDSISTGAGDDTIYSGGGRDTIHGGGGIDYWGANLSSYSAGVDIDLARSVSYFAQEGSQRGSVRQVEGFRNFVGTTGNDTLSGTALAGSTVDGFSGDDVITVYGDAGNNNVAGNIGSDRLVIIYTDPATVFNSLGGDFAGGYSGGFFGAGGGEDDTSFSGFEHFTVTTSSGADNIVTGGGNDVVSTAAGNDVIFTGAGIDVVNGGADIDVWGADLSGVTTAVTIDLSTSSSYLGTGLVSNVEGFRNFVGTERADVLIGTALSGSTVNGGGGADAITVYGDGGNNQVQGGDGNDRLTVIYTQTTGVFVSLGVDPAGGYSGSINGSGPGGSADDTSFNGIENFTFQTGAGGDSLISGAGRDSIFSGGGNDTIYSGSGVDTIRGGNGVDTWGADLTGVNQAVTIDLSGVSKYLGSGSIQQVEGFRNFTGGERADTLIGTALSGSTVNGGGGDDFIQVYGDGGSNQVAGGAGRDRLSVIYTQNTGVNMSVSGDLAGGYGGVLSGVGGGEDDTNYSGFEDFSITTAGGNDSIATGDGNDVISTGEGADTIFSGAGIDVVNGGGGVDTWGANLSAFGAGVTINLAAVSTFLGTGSIQGIEGFRSFTGTEGADSLIGTSLSGSTVNGGGGADYIELYGNAGNNQAAGGDGRDRLSMTYTADSSINMSVSGDLAGGYSGVLSGVGGSEDDTNYSGFEDFSITTAGGADTIATGAGNDFISTGGGDDTIYSGAGGVDTINGGAGIDTWGADLTGVAQSVLINLGGGVSAYLGTGSIQGIEGFRNFTGGEGNDTLIGTASSGSTVNGGGGDDTIHIFTAGGNNQVAGGAGVDTLIVTISGATTVGFSSDGAGGYNGSINGPGGSEDDTNFSNFELFQFTFAGSTGVNASFGDAADTVTGGTGADTLSGNGGDDLIDGGGGQDRIFGGTGSDTLSGGNGADTIDGGDQNDRIDGGVGRDSLIGGAGVDTLIGGDAEDTLVGGLDRDILTGGSGTGPADLTVRDTFQFGATDSLISADNYDVVTDFVTGVDKIDLSVLSGAPAAALYARGTIATDNVADAVTKASQLMAGGDKQFIFVAGDNDGFLLWSTDGDLTTAECVIRLTGANAYSDFARGDLI